LQNSAESCVNLLLLHPEDFSTPAEVVLHGRRFEHLKKIVHVQPGQAIEAGVLNGQTGQAHVIALSTASITLQLDLHEAPPPPPVAITLLLALPRPLMLKRILQTVTTMGIKDIHLIHTRRVEKSYWNSSDLAPDVLQHQLILGLEQARDTILPQLHLHQRFHPFITTELPALLVGKRALLAHPGNHAACPCHIDEPVVLAVGPEGGLHDDEVLSFVEQGFELVQIGKRVLRVEAAVTALLGRLLPCL
jgi:RsmE family RNA methyltransferase